MSAKNMEFINWKLQRRRKDTKEKKYLETLLGFVKVAAALCDLKRSQWLSETPFELLGELIWTLVYASVFTTER